MILLGVRALMRIFLILLSPNLFRMIPGYVMAHKPEDSESLSRNSTSTSAFKDRNFCDSCNGIGNNSSCRVVSGIFSSPQLNMGYNLIAHIPRGACNLSVTEMRKSPNHLALKRRDGVYIVNGNWKLSQSGEYQHAGTAFTYSRQTLRSLESISSPGPIVEPIDIMLLYQQPNPIIRYEYVMTSSLIENQLRDSITNLAPQDVTARPRHYSFSGTTQSSSKILPLLQNPQQHQPVPFANNGKSYPFQFQELIQRPSSYPADNLNYHSYNSNRDSSFRDKESERKFIWRINSYTNCSEPCAGGIQFPIVRCVKAQNGNLVGDKRCSKEGKPTFPSRRCNVQPCPAEWKVDNYLSCDTDCGDGFRHRSVTCHQKISQNLTMQVTEGACLQQKPNTKEPCNVPCNNWRTFSWSECSKPCGSGVRNRTVVCVGQSGNLLPSRECEASKKPEELKACNMGPCEGVEWFVSDWSSECSQHCGAGTQTRHVVCSRVEQTIPMSPEPHLRHSHYSTYPKKNRIFNYSSREAGYNFTEEEGESSNLIRLSDIQREERLPVKQDVNCDESGRPSEERNCLSEQSCEVPSWFSGSWGKCSSTCGNGIKTRQVLCLYFSGEKLRVAPEVLCTSKKPAERQACVISEVCPPRWFTTEWSECSTSCGGGLKKRSVSCRASNWTLPSTQCNDFERPSTSSSCNEHSCELSLEGHLTTRAPPVRNNYNEGAFVQDSSQSQSQIDRSNQRVAPFLSVEFDDKTCSDQYQNCALVLQARLCRYRYYRSVCCKSCWGST